MEPCKHVIHAALVAAALSLHASGVFAVTLTFDDAISGATSYSFDADSDGTADAVFTTSDPGGFNTVGPGPNMTYIDEPGLEGTTSLAPDLRVNFPLGAVDSLTFGFALSADAETPNLNVTFRVYDAADNLLGSVTQLAEFTQPTPGNDSSFPEASASVAFSGTAAYATFDFDDTDTSRYIMDNFAGTFGSTERPPVGGATAVPVMAPLGMAILSLLLGWTGVLASRRRTRR